MELYKYHRYTIKLELYISSIFNPNFMKERRRFTVLHPIAEYELDKFDAWFYWLTRKSDLCLYKNGLYAK